MVERWDVFELRLAADATGEVTFVKGRRRFVSAPFTDEDGVRRVRFSPDEEGPWTFEGAGVSGEFTCTPASEGNHGPVRVAGESRFAYADGTAYHPFGTTAYEWYLGSEPERAETLRSLASAPFNRVRMAVTPERLPQAEDAVRELRRLGIEAELVLSVPHSGEPATNGRQGLVDMVSRLAAFRNVWWCVDSPAEQRRHTLRLVQEYDYGRHLLTFHGGIDDDYGAPWITHLSIRHAQVRVASELTGHYRKPVVIDDCGSEGDAPDRWHSLTGQEMVVRVWEGFCRGGFVSHGEAFQRNESSTWSSAGGRLTGDSVPRIAFLRELLDSAPADLGYDRNDHYASMLRSEGRFYLQYYGPHRFPLRRFFLPPGEYVVDVIDTWNMTVERLPGTRSGEFTVELPAELYFAVRIRRVERRELVDRDGERRAVVDGTSDGLRLTLSRRDAPEPFVTLGLSELLTYSTERPWRMDFPGLREQRVNGHGNTLAVSGRLGHLDVRLRLAFEDEGLRVEATWTARARVDDLSVGLVLPLPRAGADGVLIPGVLYHNNPASDPDRVVPKLGLGRYRGLICEEHRLPIPAVNVEWRNAGETGYLTLLAEPGGGSLGAVEDNGIAVAAMSGVVMFNGEPDVAYVHKARTGALSNGYRRLGPGETLTRRYLLDWGTCRSGQGFRPLVRTAQRAFTEPGVRPMTVEDLIRYKKSALDHRWYDAKGSAGYLKFSADHPRGRGPDRTANGEPLHFTYGWTGQCLKLAWCDAELGRRYREPYRIQRCRRAVDFYLSGSTTLVTGLRFVRYLVGSQEWTGFTHHGEVFVPSRAYGETMADLADIVELFQQHDEAVPARWLQALAGSADFFSGSVSPSGLVPFGWSTTGKPFPPYEERSLAPAADPAAASGLPAVLALAKTFGVTGVKRHLTRAEELFAAYQGVPLARSTLDAACEDKESGIYHFLCAHELWKQTGDRRYREAADLSADWLSTWVYVWNPDFDDDTPFHEAGFSAVGWPSVSVQNHHLDVFFPVPEFGHVGRAESADTMLHAMAQGICTRRGEWGFTVTGEQAEGFFQTNWQERGSANTWNPSWVIAQVLSNALKATSGR